MPLKVPVTEVLNNPGRFVFGEFELAPESGELYQGGQKIPFSGQPARLLLYLVQRAGTMVTREELRTALWPEDTFVDFDHGLNNCIRRIRQALGDSIESPRFIVTLPKRGYRFVGPVGIADLPKHENNGRSVAGACPAVPDITAAPLRPRTSAISRWLLPAGFALACLSGLAVWNRGHQSFAPRISEFVQLTHVGHIRSIAGTDGSRIYFNPDPFGNEIEQVGVSGGEIANVSLGSLRGIVVDVSPDGASMLVQSIQPPGVWAAGILGAPRFIANTGTYGHAGCHIWSPDAKYIAYCTDNSDFNELYVMRGDGTEVHRLVSLKGLITDIAWSPDGSRLRFTLDESLWEISSSGSNLHRVLSVSDGPTGQCCGRWTPDGRLFLFLALGNSRNRGGVIMGFNQIWALDERRSVFRHPSRELVQLTSGPIRWETPIPSKDGQKIFASGAIERGELVRFNFISNQLQLFLGGISAEYVSFSKDGSQIAYVTYPDGVLWRANADGSNRVPLTTPPIYPLVCRWSPDGTQILFTANYTPTDWAQYTVPSQGGNPTLIVPVEKGVRYADGSWSPDGHKIVYDVDPDISLRIYDLERQKNITIPGSSGLFSPRWSPDGRYIAAMTHPGLAVKLFDVATQQWSTLAENMGGWGFPNWSHDSKFLYVLNTTDEWTVYRFRVPREKPERVAVLPGFHPVGAVGFWMGLDPNDAPLLLRNNGTSDIYALTLDRR